MEGLRKVIRVVLSVVVAFLLIPAWLWTFDRLGLNGWGFFHGGFPPFIGGIATYWLLGFLAPFRRPRAQTRGRIDISRNRPFVIDKGSTLLRPSGR
jgi:hypothetical protein